VKVALPRSQVKQLLQFIADVWASHSDEDPVTRYWLAGLLWPATFPVDPIQPALELEAAKI
jgi:hypothetical protein